MTTTAPALIQRKATTGTALTLPVGLYFTCATIDLPAGAEWGCSMQVRIPAGCWAEMRLVRVGWGADTAHGSTTDATGHHPFRPVPGWAAFSDGHAHSIKGGGPVRYQLRVHRRGPGPARVVVPTVICKAYRVEG